MASSLQLASPQEAQQLSSDDFIEGVKPPPTELKVLKDKVKRYQRAVGKQAEEHKYLFLLLFGHHSVLGTRWFILRPSA
jgi:hypothetical protein